VDILVKIYRIFDSVLNVISCILSFLLVALVLIVCFQTFFRYVVFRSLAWSEELSRYLFVIIVSCGFGIGISKGALIRINIIDGHLGPRGLQFMQVLYDAAGIVVCAVLAIYNLQLIGTGMTRLTSALAPIRFGHLYMVMEAGFVLSLIAAVLQLIKAIVALCSPLEGEGVKK